ncbi:MAG: methyltransferase domain-containing protein [Hyphomicrobiaceae bacterium]|nr:MAG: methyltransferase domain-containing protein [Hyphomicrobiaceae bacterium]
MTSTPRIFDRDLLDRRRTRAAHGAARHDFLLERAADDILWRLEVIERRFEVAAIVGAHHGILASKLAGHRRIGTLIALERNAALLGQVGPDVLKVQADEEALPFADGSLDLVVSALALQHVNDLPGVLIQARRALKPDGLLLASLLGGSTLTELRGALIAAEEEEQGGASPRVAPFADVRDLGGLLQRAGFALPVADADIVRVTYADALALMRDIRAMGASNILHDRSRAPMPRAMLAKAVEIYASRHGLPDGRVPATFELLTMTAWVPHESQQKPLAPGQARMRLADALGTDERPAGEKADR